MSSDDIANFLGFEDWRMRFSSNLAAEPWQIVYGQIEGEHEDGLVYSTLIPAPQLVKALEDHCWDLSVGDGMPGISESGQGKNLKQTYDRLGFLGGIEPLVICRIFHSGPESFREISEEFRLFHNLYQGKKREEYFKDDDAGNPEVVARILPDRVEIRTKEIRQFLAVKDMHLSIQVDVSRYSEMPVDSYPGKEREQLAREKDHSYHWGVRLCDFRKPYRTHAYFCGKKLVGPLAKSESGVWPFKSKETEKYPTFIIGRDDHGEPVEFTCDPGQLSNYFGANPGAPHYLTPVHFRAEVLTKYYSHAERYSVEDGYLRAASLWGLKMDNDHPDRVVVFLGDLGRDLPEAERDYWRTFNIVPEGPAISKTAFTRSIRGWFADPTRPDLAFKSRFRYFCEKWKEKFGWNLFLPLSSADRHHFTALRIPVHNDQGEFDAQVQSLTKLMVDSLNEAKLAEGLSLPVNTKGISKFEAFLNGNNFKETALHIEFLRNLQELRSTGVAHRKGSGYAKMAKVFDLENKELKEVAAGLFGSARQLTVDLGKAFLPGVDW
jgi:hypothetical protein